MLSLQSQTISWSLLFLLFCQPLINAAPLQGRSSPVAFSWDSPDVNGTDPNSTATAMAVVQINDDLRLELYSASGDTIPATQFMNLTSSTRALVAADVAKNGTDGRPKTIDVQAGTAMFRYQQSQYQQADNPAVTYSDISLSLTLLDAVASHYPEGVPSSNGIFLLGDKRIHAGTLRIGVNATASNTVVNTS